MFIPYLDGPLFFFSTGYLAPGGTAAVLSMSFPKTGPPFDPVPRPSWGLSHAEDRSAGATRGRRCRMASLQVCLCRTDSWYDKAIEHFKKAWYHAMKALKKAVDD